MLILKNGIIIDTYIIHCGKYSPILSILQSGRIYKILMHLMVNDLVRGDNRKFNWLSLVINNHLSPGVETIMFLVRKVVYNNLVYWNGGIESIYFRSITFDFWSIIVISSFVGWSTRTEFLCWNKYVINLWDFYSHIFVPRSYGWKTWVVTGNRQLVLFIEVQTDLVIVVQVQWRY